MAKRKKRRKLKQWCTKHRKIKIEQHGSHWKPEVNLGVPEGITVPVPYLAHVVLLLMKIVLINKLYEHLLFLLDDILEINISIPDLLPCHSTYHEFLYDLLVMANIRGVFPLLSGWFISTPMSKRKLIVLLWFSLQERNRGVLSIAISRIYISTMFD